MTQQPELFDMPDDQSDSSFLAPSDLKILVNVGVREGFGLGYKDPNRVSYAESAAVCQAMLPDLFADDKIFNISQISEDIQVALYEQRAEAQRVIRNTDVTALMLVDEDIAAKEKEIAANPHGKALTAEWKKLLRIRRKIKKEPYVEHQVLERDVFQVRRNLPISGQGRGYIEFRLPHGRALRLRLLHPNKPEHSTGVDLVYEYYWDEEDLVRIAVMQYKMLENNILSMSSQKEQERFEKQLNKMKREFCKNTYCDAPENGKMERWFSKRYCSAFVRPTDQQQKPEAQYVSTGYHIPLCRFRDLWDMSTSKKLSVHSFQGISIRSEAFEELFNMNELGSKWLTYEELEKFYKKHKVLEPGDRIVIHVQEFARS
jgi:hypothetical protein